MSTNTKKKLSIEPIAELKPSLEQTQIVQSLSDKLKNAELQLVDLKEIKKDFEAIKNLIKEFKVKTKMPENITFIWVVSNYKAIISLFKEVLVVLKTKG